MKRNSISTSLVTLLSVALASLIGCANITYSKPQANGNCNKGVVFRGEWQDYYIRAKCNYEKSRYNESLRDYFKALEYRSKDKWDVRSYGMHFIDYFPNREVGITYYKLGKFSSAIKSLEKSIQQERSERALYYLARARELMNISDESDAGRTNIETNIGPQPLVVNTLQQRIDLQVSDPDGIAYLKVNEYERYFYNNRNQHDEDIIIDLKPGINRITIDVLDVLNNSTKKTHEIYADITKPNLVLDSASNSRNGEIEITGLVSDDSEIRSLAIGGEIINIIRRSEPRKNDSEILNEYVFQHFYKREPFENSLAIVAVDSAGNTRFIEFELDELSSSAHINRSYKQEVAQLSLEGIIEKFSPSQIFHGLAQFYFADSENPEIKFLNASNKEVDSVNAPHSFLVLTISVEDNYKLSLSDRTRAFTVSLNDVPVQTVFIDKKSSNQTSSRKIRFDVLLDLGNGVEIEDNEEYLEHVVEVSAKDWAKNEISKKALIVAQRKPERFKTRMSIQLSKDENYHEIDKYSYSRLADALEDDLNERFVVDHDVNVITDLIAEISLVRHKNDGAVEILAQPKNGSRTIEGVGKLDVYVTEADEVQLESISKTLAAKIIQMFPVVRTSIREQLDDEIVLLDTGTSRGLSEVYKSIYYYCSDFSDEACANINGLVGRGKIILSGMGRDTTQASFVPSSKIDKLSDANIDLNNIIAISH